MTTKPATVPADLFAQPLLTVRQAAAFLNVSVRTVRRMIAHRRLPVVRLGRIVRIRPEALAALLK